MYVYTYINLYAISKVWIPRMTADSQDITRCKIYLTGPKILLQTLFLNTK